MSNLPPGVTESMIPGNRPEDEVYDHLLGDPGVDRELCRIIDAIVFDETGALDPVSVAVKVAEALKDVADRIDLEARAARAAKLTEAVGSALQDLVNGNTPEAEGTLRHAHMML